MVVERQDELHIGAGVQSILRIEFSEAVGAFTTVTGERTDLQLELEMTRVHRVWTLCSIGSVCAKGAKLFCS